MTSTKATHSLRELIYITPGMPASDGDGVKMTRIIGTPRLDMLDPFLMLDCFESDQPQDYLGGFPDHPHRGFETVTYMLAGRMRHRDSMGNEGVIAPHGVQWMTAGKGIVHSEMPEQESGLLKGFQLWVNLPAKDKMCEPSYQEFVANDIATEQREDGGLVRVIAGATEKGTVGPVNREDIKPVYMHVELPAGGVFEQSIKAGDNAFIFVIEGDISLGNNASVLPPKHLGVLSEGDYVSIQAGTSTTQFILVSGTPIKEPVARGGPFVMNTQAEVMQAFDDYRHNRF
jgi:redox-sensitive bicupin YhaK (pirin superfamily)